MNRKLHYQKTIKNRHWPSMAKSRGRTFIKKTRKSPIIPNPKIIIIIEGGVLQVVYSNVPVKYALIDYDKEIPIEESFLRGVFPSEVIEGDLAKLYELTDEELHGLPDAYAKIYAGLRAQNF